LTSGSISQDGTIVVLADAYQTKLYSIEYDPINISVLRKMDLGAYSTAFTPDGQLLLGGFDGSVHIIDLNTWKAQSYKQHTKAVTRLGVSSCGTFILSGDSSKKIVCYNTEEKKVFLID
jgi:WD40 repeat protein